MCFSLCVPCRDPNKADLHQRISEVTSCEWLVQFQMRRASVETSCCISELPVFHSNINRIIYRYRFGGEPGYSIPNGQQKLFFFPFHFLSHNVTQYATLQLSWQTANARGIPIAIILFSTPVKTLNRQNMISRYKRKHFCSQLWYLITVNATELSFLTIQV